MEKIIDPIDVKLIEAELTPDKKLCDTAKGGNVVYTVTAHEAPNTMKEIGRLREESFRAEGGSSGLSMDIDEFDTMERPYHQMIVWDPEGKAILGGYRYISGQEVQFGPDGQPLLATAHMFHFSDAFITRYLPHTIELGRSFVSLGYQSSKGSSKSIYVLDNLWDGLTALMMENKQMVHFFGKMTMYPHLDPSVHDLILHFLWKHYGDSEELIRPVEPIMPKTDGRLLDMILHEDDFKADYRLLKEAVRKLGGRIPPLVNSYMTLSPSMKMFGTGPNHEFGEVDETAFTIDFDRMYSDKIDRHIEAFLEQKFKKIKARFPAFDERLMTGIRNKFKRTRNKASNGMLLEIDKLTSRELMHNPFYVAALNYIKDHDLAAMEPGRYELDGDNLILMINDSQKRPASEAKLEAHDKYIDVQVPISGSESFGIRPRGECRKPVGEMDPEKDILFFDDDVIVTVEVPAMEHVTFSPNTAHAPLIGEGSIRKAIFKVRVV